MDGPRRWSVSPTEEKVRLDHFLLRHFPDQTRSQIQLWIRSGRVQVCSRKVKTGYILRGEEVITLADPLARPDTPTPEDIALAIIYEDDELAVVEKPAGMVCHPGAGVPSGTLVNALLHHFGKIETGDPLRPGIVHRLDKFTSGLLVVAKSAQAHHGLARQFKNREVRKEYLALVWGRPQPAQGRIDLAIGRDPKNRKKISARARRLRTAVTHYSLEKDYGSLSLLRVRTETGRTHQIRVHLAHKGHPVAGDTVYGGGSIRQLPADVTSLLANRFFLHAHFLAFRHPRTGETLSFTSPLPPDLARLLASL